MNRNMKRCLAGALALLSSACGITGQEQPESRKNVPVEQPARTEQAVLVTTTQKETLTYQIKVILYPNNFTQPVPLSDSSLETFVTDIKTQVNAHIAHVKSASNGLLQPFYDGTVTISRRDLPVGAFVQDADGRYQFSSATVSTLTSQDFGSNVVGFAYMMWDPTVSTANWTYPNSTLVSMINLDPSGEGTSTHEAMHVLDGRLDAAGEPGMVHADLLQPSTHPEYTGCFTTPETRNSLNPDELYWTGDDLIQNILSYNESCRSTSNPKPLLNYCKLYGNFGTFSTNLCTQGIMLNPVVSHSWTRQAYMSGSDWLYTEWDTVPDDNNYKMTVTLYRGSTIYAQVIKTEPGSSDRGPFRYRYFHRSELCGALRNAGAPGGAFDMVFRADPSIDSQRGHRMNVSGSITCSYGVESGTYSWLTGHGGTGGTASQLSCPTGYAAVGLVGRSASYVDAVGLLCAYLYTDGTLGSAYTYGPTGGGGGTYFTEPCPSGQVLVGVRGRSYSWNDQVSGHCAPVRNWVSTSPVIGGYLGLRGGSGGTPYAETCPGGYAVTSLSLRAGTYLDYIQARCNRLSYQ